MVFPSSLYWQIIGDKTEEETILRFIQYAGADSSWKILDVGCGYGRNLKMISKSGLKPAGVDINPDIVQTLRVEGFTCFHPDEPDFKSATWDLILMSHIIEHFDYRNLKNILDEYLERLKPGGHLLFATPFPTRYFWDNFDHVKPYTPGAIEEVFGLRGRQVQFQSRHELLLRKLWIRRRPFSVGYHEALYKRERTGAKFFLGMLNLLFKLLNIASFRRIGRADGWVGLYRKG